VVAQTTFEVAFDVAPDVIPGPGDWTDLSPRIRENTEVAAMLSQGSGSASLRLDNRDGQLDPLNGSSPYNLVPMRHARIKATTGEAVFQGYVDRWPPVWRFNDAVIDVELVDCRVWLALQDLDVDLPGQQTHERIGSLLADAGWPAGLRDIGEGVVWIDPFVQSGANLLRVIEDTADAEDGFLYVSPDGKLTFRSRHHTLNSTSQLSVGGENVRVGQARAAFDGATLINVGRVELGSGVVYEARDTGSVAAYGPRVFPVRDLPVPAAEAVGLAQWVVYRFASPNLSLPQVSLKVVENVELATVLALRVGDLVTFGHTPPSGAIEVDGVVESLGHRVSDGVWRTDLSLAPYFGAGGWMTWNDDLGSQGGPGWDDEGAQWAP